MNFPLLFVHWYFIFIADRLTQQMCQIAVLQITWNPRVFCIVIEVPGSFHTSRPIAKRPFWYPINHWSGHPDMWRHLINCCPSPEALVRLVHTKPLGALFCLVYSRVLRCFIMTSSKGNIFRVSTPLCGEFTDRRWIPLTKASDAELWCFLWSAPWINVWVSNRKAGDLIRHRAHYDVIVV